MRSSNNDVPLQYWLHAVQLLPLKRLSKTEDSFVFSLVEGEPQTRKIKVEGGVTLELVCTQVRSRSLYFMATIRALHRAGARLAQAT